MSCAPPQLSKPCEPFQSALFTALFLSFSLANAQPTNNLAFFGDSTPDSARYSLVPQDLAPKHLRSNIDPSNAPLVPQHLSSIKLSSENTAVSIGAANATYLSRLTDRLLDVGVSKSPGTPGAGFGLRANAAVLATDGLALGVNALWTSQLRDLVLNLAWAPQKTGLVLKASVGHLSGSQRFNFYSGPSEATLKQVGHVPEAAYLPDAKNIQFLHSVGFSNWRAEAEQTDGAIPAYVVRETPAAYEVMVDPRRIATGTVSGLSFDSQIEVTSQVILRLSLGQETTTFPFTSGLVETSSRAFHRALLQLRPRDDLIYQIDHRSGSAEDVFRASVGFRRFTLATFSIRPHSQQPQRHGFVFSYSVPIDQQRTPITPNALKRPIRTNLNEHVLREAYRRNAQLPSSFLAKVDQTAVRTVATIDRSGLPAGASIDASGDILLTVGAGGGSIQAVTRNGQSFGPSSAIELSSVHLVLRARNLPMPKVSGDSYTISLLDLSSSPYTVTLTAIQ